jgi:class 3 adenylate cyclase/CHASE2 domain-containing sensor protein
MRTRVRTLVVALVLAALSSAAGLALYFAPPNVFPFLNRIGDYVIHQDALANAGAFGLANAPSYQEPNDNLVLIVIDEQSNRGDPRAGLPPFPFPRGMYGRLLGRLAAAGARVVTFDVDFLENAQDPAQDRAFAAGMRRVPTVLAYIIDTTSGGQIGIEPAAPSLSGSAAAHGYTTADTPGGYTIGQFPVILTGTEGANANRRLTSLATAAVESFTGKKLGNVPLVDGRLLLLPPHVTATQAISGRAGAEVANVSTAQSLPFVTAISEPIADLRALVAGKIVLIGASAQALGDFADTAQGRIPGVYVNARFIDQLLTGTFIRTVPRWLDIALIVALPLLLGLALAEIRPVYSIASCLIAIVAYVEISVAVYAYRLIWLDLIQVAGAMLLATLLVGLYRIITEGAQRRMVTNMFAMHVSPAVVDEILKTDDPRASLHLRGRRVKATIFYSDIRGFTSMSETMTPEEIYGQLNEYFDAMCQVIFIHSGYVDKFIGDCIMAVFSAPFQTPDDTAKAVKAAVEQQTLIKQLSAKWEAQGKRAFTVGMGINTGDVVMGNLGATSRMNYTVIGDNVNVAARLYNVAKGGEIIISDTTYAEVRDLVEVVEMEPVHVKGKSEPIRIYSVLGMKDAAPSSP